MSWDQPSTPEKKRGIEPAQAGTVVFLVLTVLVLLCYLAIFVNPQIPINPFPPLSPKLTKLETATPMPTEPPTFTRPPTFPPTWTPTLTPSPTWTNTPRPTWTPAPPTSTPRPLAAFSLYWDPITVEQKLYPSASSWWVGLAGEVADRDRQPVTDVTIKVWDDFGHVWETQPGNASRYADEYGTSYGGRDTYAWWEQVLKGSCREVITAHVQVIRNGQPASYVTTVETSGNCDKNLILIHFQRNY